MTTNNGISRVQASLSAKVGLTATADIWPALALQHLWNARHMAALCKTREDAVIAQGSQNIDYEVRGLAMVTVASAAGFVESLINEIFRAAGNAPKVLTPNIAGISPGAIETMKALWNPPTPQEVKPGRLRLAWDALWGRKASQPSRKVGLERRPAVDKYQGALSAIGKPTAMPKGQPTCQDVQTVLDLRNALLHYTPEWQSITQGDVQSRYKRMPESRQLVAGVGFPSGILNADAAKWACDVCVAMVDEWSVHMGLTNPPDTQLQTGDWPPP